jgi:hypothetical protein
MLGQKSTAILATLLLVLLLGACAKPSPNDRAGTPRPASAEERWPQSGTLGYKLGTADCGDTQTFSRKADYCTTLQNHSSNHTCTLDARRSLYQADCGGDFEETSIQAKTWASYDSRLERECSTAPAGLLFFERQSQACAFLKNENVHRGCLWDARRDEFRALECQGGFSPAPLVAVPAPTPLATPAPLPAIDRRPQVARDLEAGGIIVEAQSDIDVDPLHPFDNRLAKFWPVLEEVKAELLARRERIAVLKLSEYVSYDAVTKTLHLTVDFRRDELAAYFQLFDRRTKWEKQTGIGLDLGVEIYGFEPDKSKLVRERIAFLEKNQAGLAGLKGALRVIRLDTASSYSFDARKLTVKYSDYQRAIESALKPLAKAKALFAFADTHDLLVDGDYSLEESDDPVFADRSSELESFLGQVLKETRALGQLTDLGVIERLKLSSGKAATQLFGLSQTLALATVGENLLVLSPVLRALAGQYGSAQELRLNVKASLPLDKNYVVAEERLQARLTQIRTRSARLKRVELGTVSSYRAGVLVIGYQGSMAELDSAILAID